MRIVSPGHGLFALAGIGIAVLSLVYGDLAPMWEFFLPDSMPVRGTWIEGFALLMLAASAGLCFPRTALPSALAICAYYLVCAATRVEPIVAEPLSVGAWYGFCEALTGFAGIRILYAMLQPGANEAPSAMGKRGVRRAQILFGLTCAFYGLSHFVYADYTASMVPTYLPAALGLAYFTGIGHAAAGVAIVVGVLPRLAATLEAIMMSLFGLLVWLPTFFMQSPPAWATPPQGQWTEVVVNVLLAACAWIIAESLRNRPWGFASR